MKNDMSYLKEMPIAVLGGGAVGKTVAADCKLAGREVRLYSRSEKSIAGLEKSGILLDGVQHSLYGFERSGKAYMDVVSTDMEKVVKGAGLIIISIPAHGHEHYLKTLVPLLEDGQVIHVFTDNYASLLLRRYMREMGCNKKVIVGGWGSAPYGTRIEKIGGYMMPHVGAKYRAITLRGACQPMTDIDDFLESAKYLPAMDAITQGDGPVAGDTMLDIGFSNVNPVIHVPASILGVSSMENWSSVYGNEPDSYSMYSHGLCPSIARVQYQFYQEEKAIADAIGVKVPKYEYEMFFSRRTILTQEYMGLDENGKDNVVFPLDKPCNEGNVGPNTIDHRYFTEDIPVGCKIYHDLGVKFGVSTPIIDCMIILGGAMHEKNFFTDTKYDLDYLGIGHMSKEELLKYLYTGEYTE
ncbi:NAD(P)-binding domain-containing protein [Lachnospiraceae bacterium WCA-9-b2]|uniref:NAD(P)-binding domain-containing protein n=1 Tax=Sporofaciens musculi TaxID=2681861 RepID=A0A7X3SI74_9FIRM|nr:NAD/NADP-dependent octopine/nopaline dehydrogenase family protein [Sporofaciens musculi]MXP75114.1 NAD(P)-binding domain-containing protein [Sporofaciens musculi]